jgi:Domain of unknown function (DUF4160)
MPEISRFFGIIIAMYYDDHEPPHFHVRYGEQKAIITIDALTILRGQLGSRAHSLVTGGRFSTRRNYWRTGRLQNNRRL